MPVLVASATSHLVTINFLGNQALYAIPPFPALHIVNATWFLPLGPIVGLWAPLFLQLFDLTRLGFTKTKLSHPANLSPGGLGVGLLSLYAPEVWGNGLDHNPAHHSERENGMIDVATNHVPRKSAMNLYFFVILA